MRNVIRCIVIGAVLAAGGIATAVSAAAEPIIGAWALNLSKSQFGNGPTPKSVIRTYSQVGDMVDLKLTGVGSDGLPLSQHSAFRFDGKDYPYTGRAEFDSVSARRIDSHQYETTQRKSGRVVSTTTISISSDGKTFTQVSKRLVGTGAPIVTAIYERQ